MSIAEQVQLAFAGVDPASAADKLQDGNCATATNIDFSVEPGAAAVRLGSAKRYTVGSGPVYSIFRRYTNNLGDLSPFYIRSGNTIYRGSSTFTAIDTLGSIDQRTGYTNYQGRTFIAVANPAKSLSDDGTRTVDWVLATPATAPVATVGVNTATLSPAATTTFTLTDGTTGTGTTLVLGDTATADATTFKITMVATLTGTNTNLNVIGTATVGDYGYTNLTMLFGDFRAVARVTREYSIGDTTFNARYYDTLEDVSSLPGVNLLGVGPYFYWVTSRQDMQLDPGDGTVQISGGWSNIKAVRFSMEAYSATTAAIGDWKVYGDEDHPLNALTNGYSYYETFAETNSDGDIINESPPSAISNTVICAAGQGTITSTATYTGGTTTYLDKQSDLVLSAKGPDALLNFDTDTLPSNIVCVSEPFYDRIVVGYINNIAWSLPGMPGVFPPTSNSAVSHIGDEVYGLIVWPPGMIIVNRDSIYEWHGSVFEGADTDYVLQRTGAGRGSKASRTIIKTPYGVPILDYDGIYIYQPGQGVETPISWAMDVLGDSFRSAVVSAKGNRIPAINKGYITTSVAAWAYNRLYLGVPTGSATTPNTVFVLDFATKRAWWYVYPWNFTSMFYNFAEDELLVGLTDGVLMSIDNQLVDSNSGGTATGIGWKLRTRTWTSPSDARLENIAVEGQGTAVLTAVYDSTNTVTLATFTNTAKDWVISPLSGSLANNVYFELNGTASDASNRSLFSAVKFDAIIEPVQVRYFRTEPSIPQAPGESLWDVHYAVLDAVGTGTVLGTVYVDNIAVMTATITASASSVTNGVEPTVTTFPRETYGKVSYTIYNAGTNVTFKHYNTSYNTRPEPDRLTSFVSSKQGGNEHEWKSFEPVVDPLGSTVLATIYVDSTAVTTCTITGSGFMSLAFSLPRDTYGRAIWASYVVSGSGWFKHYATNFDGVEEPDRQTSLHIGPITHPSGQDLKTWVAELNPLGTCTGVLWVDNVVVSTATFTGTRRTTFDTSLELLGSLPQTGTSIDIYYTGSSFKHYRSDIETTPRPFAKTAWTLRYTKPGGISQLDMPRFWSYDIEVPAGTATITSVWDIDGSAFSTNTLVVSGRTYRDRVPFAPGARGYLCQQRLNSTVEFRVWRSSLDFEQIGVKGFTRRTARGVPADNA